MKLQELIEKTEGKNLESLYFAFLSAQDVSEQTGGIRNIAEIMSKLNIQHFNDIEIDADVLEYVKKAASGDF